MARNVQSKHEIALNNILFPITGQVSSNLENIFPEKINFGDYDYGNQKFLSSWNITDWSGSQNIETWNVKKHTNRYWWGKANGRYPGHLTIAPLATSTTPPVPATAMTLSNTGFETWSDANTPTGWTPYNGTTDFDQESTIVETGTYSNKLYDGSTDASGYQDAANWSNDFRGVYVSVAARMYQNTADYGHLRIDDGIGTSGYSSDLATINDWIWVCVGRVLDAAATRLRVEIINHHGTGAHLGTTYFDTIAFPSAVSAEFGYAVEFNGNIYYNIGPYLFRINSSATQTLIAILPNITDLKVSISNTLLIATGYDFYYSMTTAEAFTIKYTAVDVAFIKFAHADNTREFAVTDDGAMYYCATPSASPPTWTANGTVTGIVAGTCNGIFAAVDENGNDVMYASCRAGLYIHSYSDAAFYQTPVRFANTTNSGTAYLYHYGAIFISDGLSIFKYSPTSAAITDVGLLRDDGLAPWATDGVNGYITGITGGIFNIYVTSYTGVIPSVWSIDQNDTLRLYYYGPYDNLINVPIVSNVYASRLWFGYYTTTYNLFWISEQTSNTAPQNISGYTYASGSELITANFDGGDINELKTAKSVVLFCSGTSADETISIAYRTNYYNRTSLTVGWTPLGTVVAAGNRTTTTYNFASGVGVAFYTIQFQIGLSRKTTDTLSPDLNSFKLYYRPGVIPKWSYSFQVDCSKSYYNLDSKGLEKALDTVAKNSAATLYEFEYRNAVTDTTELHYVNIVSYQKLTDTGGLYNGKINITVVEP